MQASTAEEPSIDHAVGGDLLAGPDHEHGRRPRAGRPGSASRAPSRSTGDVLGAELEQRPQRGAGPALGAGLEVAAGEDERGDPGGGLQVDVARRRRCGRWSARTGASCPGIAGACRGTAPTATSRTRRACRARPACPWWRRRAAGWSRRPGGTASRPRRPPARPGSATATASSRTARPGPSPAAITGTVSTSGDRSAVSQRPPASSSRRGAVGPPSAGGGGGSARGVAGLLDRGDQVVRA